MFNRRRLGTILVAACLWAATSAAHARCTLTVRFTNARSGTITVLGRDSQARVNGGTWSSMDFNDVELAPGETGTASWKTNMSCGGHARRDFRIYFEDSATNVIYSNTSKNDIDIYDGQTLSWTLDE